MKKMTLFFMSGLFFGTVLLCDDQGAKVEFVEKQDKIEVLIDGNMVTRYIFTDSLTKPVLFPILSPSGTVMTRQYPFARVEGERTDHKHHTGLFFTFDGANGEGFWNNSSIPQKIKHIKVKEMQGGTGQGVLSTVIHWMDSTGQAMLVEERKMTFIPGESEYKMEFDITLKALDNKVVFRDNKEGMFAIRVAHWLRENDGTGEYLSSNGEKKEKNVWGKRAAWMRLEGEFQNKTCGFVIFNHPSSTNYPTFWHARGYGLFAANPLGQAVFQKAHKKEKVEPFNLTLEAGKSAVFRFCVLVYEGKNLQQAVLEQKFKKYQE